MMKVLNDLCIKISLCNRMSLCRCFITKIVQCLHHAKSPPCKFPYFSLYFVIFRYFSLFFVIFHFRSIVTKFVVFFPGAKYTFFFF